MYLVLASKGVVAEDLTSEFRPIFMKILSDLLSSADF